MNSITISFDDSAEINSAYTRLRKLFPKNRITKTNIDFEDAEDEYLYALAMERKKNDNGIRWSLEEVMEELGITQQEIDEMEADFE